MRETPFGGKELKIGESIVDMAWTWQIWTRDEERMAERKLQCSVVDRARLSLERMAGGDRRTAGVDKMEGRSENRERRIIGTGRWILDS